MSGMTMPAAASISRSASLKGSSSRLASLRPTVLLPAPMRPTSTSERAPSRRRIEPSMAAPAGTALAPSACSSGLSEFINASYHAALYSVTGPEPCVAGHGVMEGQLKRGRRADPVPFPLRPRRAGGPRLCGDVRARDADRARAAGDEPADSGLAPAGPMRAPARLVGLFLDMLAAERGAAQNTIAAYGRDLDDYAAYLAARDIETLEADPAAVRAYVASLEPRGLKASSAARRLSAIRQFHKFLYVEGYAR